MNVLVIAQYFPPDMGGGATRAYNMAKGLSLAGCDVTVVTSFPHYPTGNIPAKYRRKIVDYRKRREVENNTDICSPSSVRRVYQEVFAVYIINGLL